MQDPRYLIAETYRQYRLSSKDDAEFTKAINECDGPDDAIRICVEHMALLNA